MNIKGDSRINMNMLKGYLAVGAHAPTECISILGDSVRDGRSASDLHRGINDAFNQGWSVDLAVDVFSKSENSVVVTAERVNLSFLVEQHDVVLSKSHLWQSWWKKYTVSLLFVIIRVQG